MRDHQPRQALGCTMDLCDTEERRQQLAGDFSLFAKLLQCHSAVASIDRTQCGSCNVLVRAIARQYFGQQELAAAANVAAASEGDLEANLEILVPSGPV